MQGLATSNAPSPNVVIPHYVFAAISFLVLTALTAISAESFAGHYFSPRLLSLTHLAALGWGTMMIFGALYQLLPVILQVGLYSENMARASFILMLTGTVVLAVSFWNFSVGRWLQLGAVLAFSGIAVFVANIFLTARKNKTWGIETDFIVTSVFWLLVTGILGLMMAFNFRFVFLPESHLLYLKIHAHTGVIGWMLLLIIGVGSRLLPMFMLSHDISKKKLSLSYYLINLGLALLIVHWLFFPDVDVTWVFAVLIVAGVLSFLSFIYEAFQKKLRKTDIGMKQSFLALFLLFLPLLLGILISRNPMLEESFLYRVYLVYGLSAFFGLITALILGQTLKTLPFIIWLIRYKSLVGKVKTPLPKDLYSEQIAKWQFWFYVLAMALLVAGILFSEILVIRAGGIFMLITAILYNINVYKILFHTVKKPST